MSKESEFAKSLDQLTVLDRCVYKDIYGLCLLTNKLCDQDPDDNNHVPCKCDISGYINRRVDYSGEDNRYVSETMQDK